MIRCQSRYPGHPEIYGGASPQCDLEEGHIGSVHVAVMYDAVSAPVYFSWPDEYYPIPCAQCGKRMLHQDATAIYPLDGMICVGCAKEFEGAGP